MAASLRFVISTASRQGLRFSSSWASAPTQPLAGKDVITASAFDRPLLDWVLDRSAAFARELRTPPSDRRFRNLLRGYVLGSAFMEPSTRTASSFHTAMLLMGGHCIQIGENSSAKKGETLHDQVKVVDNYVDLHVLRHFVQGSAKIAADATNKPVINAGDGSGEHPTQALLDLFAIKEEIGRIDDLNIVLMGDLLYGRTVHSLAPLLTLTKNVNLSLVSPVALKMPLTIVDFLLKNGVQVKVLNELPSLKNVDVIYQTRVQRERFTSQEAYNAVANDFLLNRGVLGELPVSARIMHPLPRVNELAVDIDDMPQAMYFRQPFYGLATRMALLAAVMGKA